MKDVLLLFFFLVHMLQSAYSQFWLLPADKTHSSIPFEFINNLIIVSVKLNGESLSFLLDNGVKETLLFGEVDSLHLKNTSSFTFQGLGIGPPIKGLISRNNRLEVGNIVDTSHHLYIVTDSAFNLSKNIGVHIHGILGSTFFRNNVIAIDYMKKRIAFARDIKQLSINTNKYQPFAITITNDRPFMLANIETSNQKYEKQKMLLDLGNSDPMMLFDQELIGYKITTPFIREYLGFGFNGAVYGYKNRINKLQIGNLDILQPIVSYPDTNTYDSNKLAEERVGSIGGQILSRFYIIFDYPNNKLYLRKNRNYDKAFALDMSGLEIVHEGFEFVKHRTSNLLEKENERGTTIRFSAPVNYLIELHNTYIISEVRPSSPAQFAGIQQGDILLKINGRRVGKMKLQDIKNKLQAGQDKLIRLQVSRGEQILNIEFRLVDPLAP